MFFRVKITNPWDVLWFSKPLFVPQKQSRTVALCSSTAVCGKGLPSLWWLFTQPHSDWTLPLFIPRQHTEEPSGKLDTHTHTYSRHTEILNKVHSIRQCISYHINIYLSNNWAMRLLMLSVNIFIHKSSILFPEIIFPPLYWICFELLTCVY